MWHVHFLAFRLNKTRYKISFRTKLVFPYWNDLICSFIQVFAAENHGSVFDKIIPASSYIFFYIYFLFKYFIYLYYVYLNIEYKKLSALYLPSVNHNQYTTSAFWKMRNFSWVVHFHFLYIFYSSFLPQFSFKRFGKD